METVGRLPGLGQGQVRKLFKTLTCIGLLSMGPLRGIQAEDWPRFLGPRQDNTVVEENLDLAWPAEGPPVLWAHRVGLGYSAPSVVGQTLVLFHRVGDEETVTALNTANGDVRWSHGYATDYVDRYGYNNGPRSAPLIEQDHVFTYGAQGVLTCLQLKDGKQVWQRNINEEKKVPQAFFGAGTPPLPYQNSILVNVGDTAGAGIMAFDQKTGATLWETNRHEASYSTGVIRELAGEVSAVFLTREGLVVLNPEDGKIKYEAPFRSRTHESVNAATPLVEGNEIFLSATYGVGAAVYAVENGALAVKWRDEEAMENHWSTSIRVGEYLYGVHGRHESGSTFRCIRWKDGQVMWSAPRGLGRASFVRIQDHFLAISERGDLALLEISPETYIEKAKVRLLKYPCWTPPVVSNGQLYLRNEDTLLCLDLKKADGEKAAPSPGPATPGS